ncbi:MAG: ArnT family glycosyltransferase [Planctomycetaceae bacterium]
MPGAHAVTIVILIDADQASQTLAAIAPGDELLRCDPNSRIVVAPVGPNSTRSPPSPSTSGRLLVLPSCETPAAACLLAVQSTTTEFVAFVKSPATIAETIEPEALSLARRDQVVVLEGRLDADDWWSRLRSWLEWLLVALLYGAKYDLPPGSLVIARRDRWTCNERLRSSPFVLTDRLVEMSEQGAGVVRLQSLVSEKMTDLPSVSWRDQWRGWRDLIRCWWTSRQFAGVSEPPAAALQWRSLLVAWFIGGVVLLTNLGTPFVEPDEGRHAEIAREMLLTGDWLAPQFQFQPYLDKPPLLYWLLCASYSLFGIHDWAARIVPALCALVTVTSVYVLGRRLIGERGALAAAIMLVLSLGFATCSRFLILESLLTMNVVLAMLLGVQADRHGEWRWGWWLTSAIACGLGLLTKGPVTLVLIAPPLALHHWLTSSPGPGFWRRWLVYGATSAAIGLPWFVAVLVMRPQFLSYFFWQHNLNRFLSGTNHEHSALFYIPVILISLLPWTQLLLSTIGFLLSRTPALRPLRTRELGLLLIWPVWCLTFFTAAAGKLPYYILSAIPPLMLLMGYSLDRVAGLWSSDVVARQPVLNRLHRGTWMIIGAATGIAPVLWLLKLITPITVAALTVMWVVLLLLQRVVASRAIPQLSWRFFCLIAVAAIVELTQGGLGGWQRRYAVFPNDSVPLAALHDPHTRIICVGASWGSVPFYLQRDDVACVDDSELERLADVVDPEQPTILLVEYKLPLDLIESSLPSEVDAHLLTRSSRVLFAELVPAAGNLDD